MFSVNAHGTTVRSMAEMKKTLSEIKGEVKKKVRTIKSIHKGKAKDGQSTGGGSAPPPLSSWEEKVHFYFIYIILLNVKKENLYLADIFIN